MEVYLMHADMELMSVSPCEQKDLNDLALATRSGFEWPVDRSVKLKILVEKSKDAVIYSDNPYFESLFPLCLSSASRKFFEEVFATNGYLIDTDLTCAAENKRCSYKLFFFTSILDVLDLERSKFKSFSDGRTMRIYRHFILEDGLAGQSIFKMKHALRNETFVTGDMKTQIEQAGLVGLLFNKIWSTEEGPFDVRLSSPYVNVSDKRKARRLVSTKRQQARKILTARSSMW